MQRLILVLTVITLLSLVVRTSDYTRESVKQGGVDHHFRSIKHHLNMFNHHLNMSKIKKSMYPHLKMMKHHMGMMGAHHEKLKNLDQNMAQAAEGIMNTAKNIM